MKLSFDDLGTLQYTGGTTGVSKGVMLTHGNLSKNVQQITAWFPSFLKGQETSMGALPFFHSFGMTTVMNLSLYSGYNVILIPRPEPQVLLEATDAYKPSFLPLVPTLFRGNAQAPRPQEIQSEVGQGLFLGRGAAGVGDHQGVRGRYRLPDLRRVRPVRDEPRS